MKQLTVRYASTYVEAFYEGRILYRWSDPILGRQHILAMLLNGWKIIREDV